MLDKYNTYEEYYEEEITSGSHPDEVLSEEDFYEERKKLLNFMEDK
ncbi:MAG: hypothetical protein ACOCVF_02960 [bacterium]